MKTKELNKLSKPFILLALSAIMCTQSIKAQHTNVLWISIDDLNNWVGYLEGHPQVKTPNMDRLAERGVAFTNAHCTTPLCNPSRSAILSGISEENTGIYNNGNKFNHENFKVIPQYLADHNYVTYGTGKIHHNSINDEIFQHAYSTQQRWSPFKSAEDVDYSSDELPSKGTDNPCHVIEDGPGGKSYVLPFNGMPSERSPKGKKGESFDWAAFDLPDEAFGDRKITDWALEQLKGHDQTKPFFMGVGYYRPHIPLYAPKKYFDMYPIEEIQLPRTLENDLCDVPPAGIERAHEAVTAGTHQMVLKHKQWKNAVQAYLACISFIDEQIGLMLDYLEASPYAENTIIILFSDHGWHLGEKQAWGKMSPWIHSTNTPFIICPVRGAKTGLCHEPVSLLDIYPTLTDMLSLPRVQCDGVSLLPLLSEPGIKTKRVVRTFIGEGNYALSSSDWRYIHYENGDEELYHIKSDPLEFDNLIGQSKSQKIIDVLKERIK